MKLPEWNPPSRYRIRLTRTAPRSVLKRLSFVSRRVRPIGKISPMVNTYPAPCTQLRAVVYERIGVHFAGYAERCVYENLGVCRLGQREEDSHRQPRREILAICGGPSRPPVRRFSASQSSFGSWTWVTRGYYDRGNHGENSDHHFWRGRCTARRAVVLA
jgi:hypothetical protein